MKLTQSQRQAIEYAGRNLQLIACAGSGKTEVVARRVAHLLTKRGDDNLKPRNIVAFTFTNKAAAELKERIVRRTVEVAGGDTLGMADMYVGTIHGFCQELLQSEIPEFLKYEVLDETRQKLYVNRNSRKTGLTTSSKLSGPSLKRWQDTDKYLAALSILREDDVDVRRLADCSVFDGLTKYRDQLAQDSYFDFSALLELAVNELTHNQDLRTRLSKRVKHVIVDEYQDVNPVQERLIRLLHDLGANLCVVGDDDQTIYQWRGSSVGNILKFQERYPSVEQIRLEDNFRSSKGVIDVANRFVKTICPRLSKEMKFADSQRYEPGDISAVSFKMPEEEAEYIVETIKSLHGVAFDDDGGQRGLSWSDMAILLRSVKYNGTVITESLKKADIPFTVKGLPNLFKTDEAHASQVLFQFLAGESEASKTKCDAPNVQSLRQAWDDAHLGLSNYKLDHAMQYATTVYDSLRTEGEGNSSSIQKVFLKFLALTGLREEDVPGDRGEVAMFNLGRFSQVIADWESINPNSRMVEDFHDFARFLHYEAQDSYGEEEEDSSYAVPDAVQVMTVHQAKGREWPVVFLPALLRNRFPSIGRKSPAWQLIPREAVSNAERYDGSNQDERRLLYVAMTRSKKFLHMTWAPIAENQLYRRQSEFWYDVLTSKFVTRHVPDYTGRKRATAKPRTSIENVEITVTDLKDLFECGYRFKLNALYGFNSPDAQFRMLYGKLLHDVLADIHQRCRLGESVTDTDVPELVRSHLHSRVRSRESAAQDAISQYVQDNAGKLRDIQASEQPVEIDLGDGFIVKGRIDLIRRAESGQVTIVDTKAAATEDSPQRDYMDMQLYMYAIGFKSLTGSDADFIEIYGLNGQNPIRRPVNGDYISQYRKRASAKMSDLRNMRLRHDPAAWKCKRCDFSSLCDKSLA